jgi:hypothetical protein
MISFYGTLDFDELQQPRPTLRWLLDPVPKADQRAKARC